MSRGKTPLDERRCGLSAGSAGVLACACAASAEEGALLVECVLREGGQDEGGEGSGLRAVHEKKGMALKREC